MIKCSANSVATGFYLEQSKKAPNVGFYIRIIEQCASYNFHVTPPSLSPHSLGTYHIIVHSSRSCYVRKPRWDFRLPTSDFRLPTSDFRLPTSDFGLLSSDFRLPTSDFRLPQTISNHCEPFCVPWTQSKKAKIIKMDEEVRQFISRRV